MSVYILFVMVLSDGVEREWKSYPRFEECWEVAKIIVKHRDDITARCVLVEKKD
ncbi:hypothetical protein UFOVP257_238 [uncultured Caudovirales phage]|uniref:Uncharacterized protein n=1 Tax=uncultured Caudovirales phage TaxID=2100421 RepID=A0A6J5LK65_9CAUD|nr:hypothetical protein UFOVP257_238 [uncultured Caudovirales phage]